MYELKRLPAKGVSIEKFNKITDAPQGKVKKEQV